jgi:translocator protein
MLFVRKELDMLATPRKQVVALVVLLWAAIVATTVVFWLRSTLAGILFIPYLAWVSFAAVLNFAIWRLNG